MDIHKLLKRQLDKTQLRFDQKPDHHDNWVELLSRINQSYIESDQERYLQERAMEVFSKEMMNLNEMLQRAQRIACLGSWSFDGLTDQLFWSKEAIVLFQKQAIEPTFSHADFLQSIHEQERMELVPKIQAGLNEKIDYASDIRIKNSQNQFRWFHLIGQAIDGDKQVGGIIIDIHNKKEADKQIKELNEKVVASARRAGMVEVATSILHNIGNILNSSNVSLSLIKKSIYQNNEEKLLKICEMIQKNKDNLADFFTNDSKGKLIPSYIETLANVFIEEHRNNKQEIESLDENLKHIKQIVAMQESISGVSCMVEKLYLPEIIDTAVTIVMKPSNDQSIELVKQFDQCPLVTTDKSKLLQILVNLIQNARDATLLNLNNTFKEITLYLKTLDDNLVQVIVQDNGVGIDADRLSRIFAFGYTSKEKGHGFGLHSSALSAQEMGGSLIAESQGIGQGARFVLTLPIVNKANSKGAFNE